MFFIVSLRKAFEIEVFSLCSTWLLERYIVKYFGLPVYRVGVYVGVYFVVCVSVHVGVYVSVHVNIHVFLHVSLVDDRR